MTPDKYTKADDATLFSYIREGDSEAFTYVYNKYVFMLYTLAFRYTKDKSEAENIIQTVFLNLWGCRLNIEVSISLRNYLYSMTKNCVLNVLRNQQRSLLNNYKLLIRNPQCDDGLMNDIEMREIQEKLSRAIAQLPEQKQQIVRLKRDGFSNQEIADKLEISINTVRAHYSQCIKILRAHLITIFLILCLLGA